MPEGCTAAEGSCCFFPRASGRGQHAAVIRTTIISHYTIASIVVDTVAVVAIERLCYLFAARKFDKLLFTQGGDQEDGPLRSQEARIAHSPSGFMQRVQVCNL